MHAELTAAVFAALDDQRPSLPEQLAAEALKSAGVDRPRGRRCGADNPAVAEAVTENRRFKRSWIAALIRDRT